MCIVKIAHIKNGISIIYFKKDNIMKYNDIRNYRMLCCAGDKRILSHVDNTKALRFDVASTNANKFLRNVLNKGNR